MARLSGPLLDRVDVKVEFLPVSRAELLSDRGFTEPGCAVALPISIQGVVAAVIYADDSDRLEFASTAPQALVKFAELLLMHATLVLFRVSAEQRTARRDTA